MVMSGTVRLVAFFAECGLGVHMEDLRGSYVKIVVLEAVILAALWWFGRMYS